MKWKFICLSLFIILGQIFSIAFAEDFSKCTLSIEDLKRRLDKLQLDRDNEEKGILNSDRIYMQALELVLIARARGDQKALEVAEKAVKEAEKAKNRHKKNKELIEQEINLVNQYLKIAEENNLKGLGDVCAKYREQVERDKEVLKRFTKEAVQLSKRQEERIKEILEEKKEFIRDIILSPSLELLTATTGLFTGKIGKRIQDLISSPQIKDHQTKVKLWKLEEKMRDFGAYLVKNREEIGEAIETVRETGKWSGDIYPKIIRYIKLVHENNEYIKKNLEELSTQLKELATSQETIELLGSLEISALEDLSKRYGLLIAKSFPIINGISSAINVTYHAVKIYYLDRDVNGDYELTEDLFNQYNLLKAQFDKDWQKLKICEEYCKKNAKKE